MRTTSFGIRRQNGAILVVSLLLLLVLTVLALTASQSTRMQERMAGNARDLDLSFQAGEAGLRGAETRIDEEVATKGSAVNACSDRDSCDTEARENTGALDFAAQTPAWWVTNARALEQTLAEISADPYFITEVRADVPDTLTMGAAAPKSGTMYYVSKSRAQGATSTAVTIVESTYAIRY